MSTTDERNHSGNVWTHDKKLLINQFKLYYSQSTNTWQHEIHTSIIIRNIIEA